MNKFEIGDKVKIVNYGSLIYFSKASYKEYSKCMNKLFQKLEWQLLTREEYPEDNNIEGSDKPNNIISETDTYWTCDSNPELVGQEGTVVKVNLTQGHYKYSLEGPAKQSWYNEGQLELKIA